MIANQIMGVESGNNPFAKNPRSSAFGPAQFIDSTWLSMLSKYRPDLASLPREQQLALRSDPQLSHAMTEAYAQENGAYLKNKGLDVTPGNTYLAHFAGPEGAAKVLQAQPNASAADTLGPAVLKANPFLANMTTGQLRSWANQKMGAPTPPASIPMQQQIPNAMASAQPNLPLFSPQPTGQQPSPVQSFFNMLQPSPSADMLAYNFQKPWG